jgi:hypothetical protein
VADTSNGADECARSRRIDGLHSWEFDGDDPYIRCVFCGEVRDALTGRVIRRGAAAETLGEGP